MPADVTAEIEVDDEALRKTLDAELAPFTGTLREIGGVVVAFMKSYTPDRTEDGRPKHPGDWADKTGNLMAGYDFEVRDQGDRWELVLLNHAPHAHLVEAYEGFWVLKSIDESPVYLDALRDAIRRHMPNWELTI